MLKAGAVREARGAKRVSFEDAMYGLEAVDRRMRENGRVVVALDPPRRARRAKSAPAGDAGSGSDNEQEGEADEDKEAEKAAEEEGDDM